LRTDGEGLGQRGHDLAAAMFDQLVDELCGDASAGGLERRHRLGGEVAVDELAVAAVLGRVHTVGDRDVHGYAVAEALVVQQHHECFGVPVDLPGAVVAPRDPATAALGVPSGDRVELASRVVESAVR
jgi:hypothetical protein